MALDERVSAIIVEQLGVSKEEIQPEASFIDDLGADSLDIEIPDEDAEKIQTIGDAMNYVKERVPA